MLGKVVAAFSRRSTKNGYDIAFVLLHNDASGSTAAASLVQDQFADAFCAVQTALADLYANFVNDAANGSQAYVNQIHIDHPELNSVTLTAEAIVAVQEFHRQL